MVQTQAQCRGPDMASDTDASNTITSTSSSATVTTKETPTVVSPTTSTWGDGLDDVDGSIAAAAAGSLRHQHIRPPVSAKLTTR